MIFKKGEIEGLWIIEPTLFGDGRGYFFESFREDIFTDKTGVDVNFVQDNESLSRKGILRGLHLQKPPFGQSKLVRVIQGSVIDVAVDVRKKSPTYGHYQMIELSAENKRQFFVPEGFAHGFLTLEDNTIFQYKCSNYYNPKLETGILWDDVDLNIAWPATEVVISEKDKHLSNFKSFQSPY
jgi:dTDP-4-dehydrorhamnose 3,5-epimerase